MLESFRYCGWASFIMLFLGLSGLGACLLALLLAMTRKPVGGIIAAVASILLALASFGTGPIAAMYGRSVTDSALSDPSIDPVQRERIRAAGHEEAGACVSVGFSLGAMPLVAGTIALFVTLRAKKRLETTGVAL